MDLDKWDVIILVIAAFLAVTTLVRLMIARRDSLVQEVQEQIAAAKAARKQKKQGAKRTE